MSFHSLWRRACVAGAAAGALALAAAGPANAAGDPFACSASALRGSVLGTSAIEPVTANAGQAQCRDAQATLTDALPAPLKGAFAAAGTALSGPADRPEQRKATAAGGVADLAVRALPALPIALPTATIPDAVRRLSLPVPASLQLLGVPAQLSFDLVPAIDALLPHDLLPSLDLVSVKAAVAFAGAECRDGAAVPTGSSQVAGVKVLGQDLAVNAVVERTLTLLDTRSIELSKLDISKVPLPGALSALAPAIVRQVVTTVLAPAVAVLPPVSIPPTVARVAITPSEQTVENGVLTQRALHVQVSILGHQIADLVVGEAKAGAAGLDCAPKAAPLSCTKRKLALIDVLPAGRRVKLYGVADEEYAGRTVDILFEDTGRRVGRATVQPDGSFATTAPMPPRSVRGTNRARYVATIDGHKSLDLKLMRRMVVESMRAKDGTVTIAGRVVRPLADPVAPIEVRRRVTCSKEAVVAKVKPDADGRFRIRVPAPAGEVEGVYRLTTEVRRTASNPKRYPTFTLPRAVNLT